MMLKTAIVSAMLLAVVAAQIFEIDDNIIEFDDVLPAKSISLPYPYKDQRDKRVVFEPVAAPIYSDTYGNIIVPTTTEVEPAGLFSAAISFAFDALRAVLVFILTNAPALIAGTVVALGVCKLTPLCDSHISVYEAQTELRAFATPERLSRAAKFVKEAVRKYNEMQK